MTDSPHQPDPALGEPGADSREIEPRAGRTSGQPIPGSGPVATLTTCHESLPPDVSGLEQRFIRFISPQMVTMSRNDAARGGDPASRPAVLPTIGAESLDRIAMLLERNPDATWADVHGGTGLFSPLGDRDWEGRVAETVHLDRVDSVLETHRIQHDGRSWELTLSDSDIARLHAGSQVVAWAMPVAHASIEPDAGPQDEDGRHEPEDEFRHEFGRAESAYDDSPPADAQRRLLLLRPGSREPEESPHLIDDLPSFLADPTIPGTSARLALTPAAIATLLGGGSAVTATVVDTGAYITLHVADGGVAADETLPAAAPPVRASIGVAGSTTSPELVLALQWVQRWKPLGYARGQLLNSVALAPQEETTIDIFTWDRNNRASEMSSSVETDDSLTLSDTKRDTTDVFSETAKSSSFNWNVSGSLSVPIVSKLQIGAMGGVGGSQSVNKVCRSTTNQVHEAVVNSSMKIRSSRQSKVSESREWGSEERVSRKVTNPNMCRVLHLDYFEVMSRYRVTTSFTLDDARVCVLLPSPVRPAFNRATLRQNETALRAALLDRSLADGFAAARLLAAREHMCEAACERCTCPGTAAAAGDLPAAVQSVLVDMVKSLEVLMLAHVPPVPPTTLNAQEAFEYKVTKWRFWGYLRVLNLVAEDVLDTLYQMLHLIGNTPRPATRAEAERLWWALRVAGGPQAIATAVDDVKHRDWLTGIVYLELKLLHDPDPQLGHALQAGLTDAGLGAHLERFVALFRADTSPADTVPEMIDSETRALRDAFPAADVAHAIEREEALLGHLSQNASHYWLALWNALTASQQATWLTYSLPSSIITEPWPLGIVGDRLAFPLLSDQDGVREFLETVLPDDAEWPADRVTDVSLPTPAITAEARLGACDACEEFIRRTRSIDLKHRTATAELEEAHAATEQAEADRRQALLASSPPKLEPFATPEPPTARLQIEVVDSRDKPAGTSDRPGGGPT